MDADESRAFEQIRNQRADGDELAARGMPVCVRAMARAELARAATLCAVRDAGKVFAATVREKEERAVAGISPRIRRSEGIETPLHGERLGSAGLVAWFSRKSSQGELSATGAFATAQQLKIAKGGPKARETAGAYLARFLE